MSEVKFIDPVDSIRGKLHKEDDTYFRVRNGKRFTVRLRNPRTTYSAKEKELHKGFGELSKLASQIAKDSVKAAPYMAGFEAQKKTEGGQTSLYQYVLTQLLREAKSDRAGKISELTGKA